MCPAYSERAWPLTSVKESGRSRLEQESLTWDQHLPKDAGQTPILGYFLRLDHPTKQVEGTYRDPA